MNNKLNIGKESNDSLAITSFVLSLIPLILIMFPKLVPVVFESVYPSILLFDLPILLSIVLGIVAIVRIRKNKLLKGKGFAITGIIISVFTMLITFISFILLAKSLSRW